MLSDLSSLAILPEYQSQIQALCEELPTELANPAPLQNTEDFEALEASLHASCRQLADWLAAAKVQAAIQSEALQEEVRQLIRLQPGKLRHRGIRQVKIRFSGGTRIALSVPYYAGKSSSRKRGKGLCPALGLLGIHDGCSPQLASEISLASAALCSLEEARHMLASRGCVLNIKTVHTIVKRYAARARLTQQQGESDLSAVAQGLVQRKVVVSTDGGRVRIRSRKKGRHRYHTDWREPKLMIIYIVNEQGRLDKAYSPFLDGTLQGPDKVFALMAYYLEKLGICEADRVLFVADGALWIWERVQKLAKTLKVKTACFYELIDFYHAVEHLDALAKIEGQLDGKRAETVGKKATSGLTRREASWRY